MCNTLDDSEGKILWKKANCWRAQQVANNTTKLSTSAQDPKLLKKKDKLSKFLSNNYDLFTCMSKWDIDWSDRQAKSSANNSKNYAEQHYYWSNPQRSIY